MRSGSLTVGQYLSELPEDRRLVIDELRHSVRNNLPAGFMETMSYGMIGYVVPHSLFPQGYHADPKLPLPFISIASQKNHIALYHMGLYADPEMLKWFTDKFTALTGRKPDMGKSCLRFRKMKDIPFRLIGELASKMDPDEWINIYKKQIQR